MKPVEERLNCLGYFGFGGGYKMARQKPKSDYSSEPVYCAKGCPLLNACWDKHKERVATIVPALTEEFERMAKEIQGPKLVEKWFKKYKNADPYTIIMAGNVEDGIAIGSGGQAKDRGPGTLPFPFVEQ